MAITTTSNRDDLDNIGSWLISRLGLGKSGVSVQVVGGEGSKITIHADTVTKAQLDAAISEYTPPGPAVVPEDVVQAKRRMKELKNKGFVNLSATEKNEVAQRAMEILADIRLTPDTGATP